MPIRRIPVRPYFLSILFCLLSFLCSLPVHALTRTQWVDSVYHTLTLAQRIGQLYMIAAYSGTDKFNQPLIEKLISEQGIGGLIFMQGTPEAQAQQLNHYQQLSRVPLWVGMDAEWGLGMRLTGVHDFPKQLMLGAMYDSSLVYKMGAAIADQCRRLGVQIDFAPVVDVNSNPDNPVINFRSFGERKDKVAHLGLQYMKGLQDNGVIACAKHFPGHGDTDVDSHEELPVIRKSLPQLKQQELYPFETLIRQGLQAVMVAHLHIPALDEREHTPTTLSDKTIVGLLKGEMGFNGLVFTDALNMQGIAKYYSPGEIDMKALQAGNDVLLFSQDVPAGIEKIKQAIHEGTIPESRLEESVRKILGAKFDAGLFHADTISTTNLTDDLNRYVEPLYQQMAEASFTLLSDPAGVLDALKHHPEEVTLCLFGTETNNTFSKQIQAAGVKHVYWPMSMKEKEWKKWLKKIKPGDKILAACFGMNNSVAKKYGLKDEELGLLQTLSERSGLFTVLFGNPYVLKFLCDKEGFAVAYDEQEETQRAASRFCTGQAKAIGTLPVSACAHYPAGEGIVSLTSRLGEIRDTLRYTTQHKDVSTTIITLPKPVLPHDVVLQCCVNPDALGIQDKQLDRIDTFIQQAIRASAFPGCRILAARNGKVFYDKPFGYLTYSEQDAVQLNTVYDLASITKVAATTLAVMMLYEQGKLKLDDSLSTYLPFTVGTDKASLTLRNLLTHQAGLKAWIPFYKETVDSINHPRSTLYSHTQRGVYGLAVTPHLFLRNDWKDTIWSRILHTPLETPGKYVYSDLDYFFLQQVVETISHQSLDQFVHDSFYHPLGLSRTGFCPFRNMPDVVCAPTEADTYFRQDTLQACVHDMGAAMLGGVGGHAGLFSTATDLAVLFQMLLNGGVYQGKRYFKKETVDLFTARNSSNSRRGLGFDKPEPQKGKASPCPDNVSLLSFGHQGFTGTCVWADPQHELLFIFLSNRTFPVAENKRINTMNVREYVQEVIYQALGIAGRGRK